LQPEAELQNANRNIIVLKYKNIEHYCNRTGCTPCLKKVPTFKLSL